ncbi:hypothetical protein GCM10027270_22900 [Nocardioides ginkgobilobae]
MLSRVKTTNRRLTRPAALLGAGLLTASLALTGCSGGDDVEAYCDTLSTAKEDIDALEAGDPGAFSTAFEAFETLSEEAPEEVADEWATMNEGVQQIEDAFADAGLELNELGDVMTGEIPEGVDMEKLEQLDTTLEELDSPEFNEASDAISEHAEQECDITLGE